MKAKIINQPVNVTSEADVNSPIITELAIGSEVELGVVVKKKWISVTLSTGQQGYMPGNTRVFFINRAVLIQENVNVYAEPSAQSPIKTQYKKNDIFFITDIVKQDKITWSKIRDSSGNEGYIDGQTLVYKISKAPLPGTQEYFFDSSGNEGYIENIDGQISVSYTQEKVWIRREKKKFIVEGKPIVGKPVRASIRSELQAKINALKWPQECANCGGPVQKTHSFIESYSNTNDGFGVAVTIKVPYCGVCFPKIKRSQNISSIQLIVTFLIGIPLSILLIKIQGESDSPFIFCGLLFALSIAIGYGLSWLLVKLPAKIFMKDKIAEPVKGKLIGEVKAGDNKIVSLALSIPNEGYAAKFAELNGVQNT